MLVNGRKLSLLLADTDKSDFGGKGATCNIARTPVSDEIGRQAFKVSSRR